jgi:D-alanyl-D-alanine carboxypeptidase
MGIVAVLFGASCSDRGPTEPVLTVEERLEATLSEEFAKTGGQGLSVAALLPGRPIWVGTAGMSHGDVPITDRSVLGAGSITKTFTALTILSMVEEGLLSLDDSLHAWLPSYPFVDPDITIRQLLNHTGGLSDFADTPGWIFQLLDDPGRLWGMEEYFLETIRPPYFEKGTAWSYSSSGYLLLRMIIERASGGTVATQYRGRVLTPLGLEDTYTCLEDALPTDWAHGWWDLNGDGAYDDFTALPTTSWCSAVGGAVYTTPTDLVKLGNALMHARTLLDDATYEEMRDFYVPEGHDEPMVQGYGLGLMRFHPDFVSGLNVWGHGGNAPGYAAAMLYLVDYGVVIALMDNTEHGVAMEVLNDLLRVILDGLEGAP